MISRLVEMKAAIQQVTFSSEYQATCKAKKNDCPVTNLVGDPSFWSRLSDWHEALKPAYFFLRDVDTNAPAMDLVLDRALAVRKHYTESTFQFAPQLLQQWNVDWQYLHSPLHSAAYVLSPRNRGMNMQAQVGVWAQFLEVVEKMLGPHQGSLAVEQFNVYQSVTTGFGGQMGAASAQRMSGCVWWQAYGASVPQLQFLAMRLLSQPASASSAEQSWSEYDYVHNKRRNRLKTEVANKLVYVHANLRLLNRIQSYRRHTDLLNQSALASQALTSNL